ncbi:MAG TPA: nitrogen fixation protein NifQ [Bradyrhizobium sp.]|nr:nitrogen fixation protein NifQ [Bradyrhizobium sp.]
MPPAIAGDGGKQHVGIEVYRLLTGRDPAAADIRDDAEFDRHVLASIVAAAAMDGGGIAGCVGLDVQELGALLVECFPRVRSDVAIRRDEVDMAEDEEVAMVRDLLLGTRSTAGNIGRWLAAMVARRALEPNHLWEDLGLRDRSELSRLLARHFAPLAARNTKNMRWKRFFYRMLCEDDGLVMCTTPVCTQCNDFALCFGDESGESRMAERRRDVLAQAVAASSGGLPT